jgi:hypothetical protein
MNATPALNARCPYNPGMAHSILSPDTQRILRHLIATIAYRASRSLKNSPAEFESTRLSDDGMSARELLLHMTNVIAFAAATVTGTDRIRHDWQHEVRRFYSLLAEVDARIAAGVVLEEGMDLKLVQGPFADVLTHIGQLHAMRRKSGSAVAPANYIKANVNVGCISLDAQPD